LVLMSGANGQGVSMRIYTLLDFVDGSFVPIKSITVTEYWRRDGYGIHPDHDGNSYFMSNHAGVEFGNRDWEQDIPLTHDEFNELMVRYGLYGAKSLWDLWELPNDAYAILAMSAN